MISSISDFHVHMEGILIAMASIFALYLVGIIPAYWLIRANYGREAGKRTLAGGSWGFLILIASILFILVIWQVLFGQISEPAEVGDLLALPMGLAIIAFYVHLRMKSESMGERLICIGRDSGNRTSVILGYIFIVLIPLTYIFRLLVFGGIYIEIGTNLINLMAGIIMIMHGSSNNYICEDGICYQSISIRWTKILEMGWAQDKPGVLLFGTRMFRQHKITIPSDKIDEVNNILKRKLPNVPVMIL